MGIRGLGVYLKWRLPHTRHTITWHGHTGEKWAIDCSCLMYRARAANLSPLTVIATLLVRMRRAGIEPVVIFDGRPPAAKADVVDRRRSERAVAQKKMVEIQTTLKEQADTMTEGEKADLEKKHASLQMKAPQVTYDDKDAIKVFLHECGVRFATAYGEADDVLAELCRRGDIHAVVSNDMDMLARGVPLLIVPETNDAATLSTYRLNEILSGLGVTYEQFVDACMLMGSDYSTKGWRPVEPKSAIEMVKRGVNWSILDVSGGTMEMGARLLRGEGVDFNTLFSERQREKWFADEKGVELEALRKRCNESGWPVDWLPILLSK
jgi:flap endonuclease-1